MIHSLLYLVLVASFFLKISFRVHLQAGKDSKCSCIYYNLNLFICPSDNISYTVSAGVMIDNSLAPRSFTSWGITSVYMTILIHSFGPSVTQEMVQQDSCCNKGLKVSRQDYISNDMLKMTY